MGRIVALAGMIGLLGAVEAKPADFDGDGLVDVIRPVTEPGSSRGNAGHLHEIVLTTLPETRLRVFLHPSAFTFVRSHRGDLCLITYHRSNAEHGGLLFHAIDRAGVRETGSLTIHPRDADAELYRHLFPLELSP